MKKTVGHNASQYTSSAQKRGAGNRQTPCKQMFEFREKLDFLRPIAANSRP